MLKTAAIYAVIIYSHQTGGKDKIDSRVVIQNKYVLSDAFKSNVNPFVTPLIAPDGW